MTSEEVKNLSEDKLLRWHIERAASEESTNQFTSESFSTLYGLWIARRYIRIFAITAIVKVFMELFVLIKKFRVR